MPEPGRVRKVLPQSGVGLLFLVNALVYGAVLWIRKGFPPGGTIEDRAEFSWLWGGVFLSLSLLYVLIHRRADNAPVASIIIAYLVCSLLLILTPVLFSSDIYTYAMRGRIVSVYHQNPYIVTAADFPRDAFLGSTDPAWRVMPQNYGPLWTLISALLTWIGGEHLFGTILLFKLWGFLGNTLGLLLVYRIAKTLMLKRTSQIVALYALNPLILMEFLNNGHNDVWMVALGLLALYCYHSRKDDGIVPALILAGSIKYVFWLLIPLFLVFLWRERRLHLKLMFRSGLVSAVFLAAAYLPFWHGGAALRGVLDQSGVERPYNHYSPIILMLFVALMARRWPLASLKSGLVAGRALFLAVYAKILFSAKAIEPASVLVLTAFAFLGMATILPWYILWWLPFLMIKNDGRPVVVWTLVGLGSYFFLYSTTLSLAMVGGAYLVFLMTKELGGKGGAPPSARPDPCGPGLRADRGAEGRALHQSLPSRNGRPILPRCGGLRRRDVRGTMSGAADPHAR